MRPHTATILLAFLLAAPALAGCLENQGTEAPGATALDLRPVAEDRASQWSSDARLSKAVTQEGRQAGLYAGDEDRPEDEPYWQRNVDDGNVDGRAEVWQFEFVSASRNGTVLQVVVDADEAVVSTSTEDRQPGDAPVPADVLDSDEALEAAKAGYADLRRGLEGPNATVSLQLEHEADRGEPEWEAAGGGDDGGGRVVVDAVTGEVLKAEG